MHNEETKSYIIGGVVLAVLVIGYLYFTNRPALNSGTPPSGCIAPEQARAAVGKNACIQFTVGYTYTSAKGEMYLDQYNNYASGFTVWIPADTSNGGNALKQAANKTVDVVGTITLYKGVPEIEVTDTSQIYLAN